MSNEQLPSDPNAERALLACLMDDYRYVAEAGKLSAADFHLEEHGWIFEAIKMTKSDNQVVIADYLSRAGQLSQIPNGEAYLPALLRDRPIGGNLSPHVRHYTRIIRRAAAQRRVILAAAELARLAHQYDGDDSGEVLADKSEAILGEAIRDIAPYAGHTIRELASMVLDEIENPKRFMMSTSLPDLDRLLGGLSPKELYVVGGRPGMGKSVFGLQIAWEAAKRGAQVLFFSLEMSEKQLAKRLYSYERGIDSKFFRPNVDLPPDVIKSIVDLSAEFDGDQATAIARGAKCLKVFDKVQSIEAIKSQCQARSWRAAGLNLIVVDYLQLITSAKSRENRQIEVSHISRTLKLMANELDISVVALSQLNRGLEARHDKRPSLADLRESGSIEQDGDAVLFLYRDEVYNADTEFPNVAEIIVAKHRSGPTGVFSVYFKKEFLRFEDLEVRTTSVYE